MKHVSFINSSEFTSRGDNTRVTKYNGGSPFPFPKAKLDKDAPFGENDLKAAVKKAKKMQAKVAQQSKKVPEGAEPESDSEDDSDDDDNDDSDEGEEVRLRKSPNLRLVFNYGKPDRTLGTRLSLLRDKVKIRNSHLKSSYFKALLSDF